MLDSRPVGASDVARFHHSFDCWRIAVFFAAPEVAATTGSSFPSSFALSAAGSSAAAESSSSMTIQPLEVERQRSRLIQRNRFMPFLSGSPRICLNCSRLAGPWATHSDSIDRRRVGDVSELCRLGDLDLVSGRGLRKREATPQAGCWTLSRRRMQMRKRIHESRRACATLIFQPPEQRPDLHRQIGTCREVCVELGRKPSGLL